MLQEIQRYANITPQLLWHRCTEDIELEGYLIKKDTLIVPQNSVLFVDDQVGIFGGDLEKTQARHFLQQKISGLQKPRQI